MKRRKLTQREVLQDLCMMDDIFMGMCLDGANDCVELIINVILDRDDLKVVSSEVQKVFKSLKREVRLDVIAMDKDGRLYNIEIQRADSGAVPERARYNLSIIDVNNLEKGEDFTELPDVFVIFITEHDVLGYGLPIYTIERRIIENGEKFNDRTKIVYVNGESRDLNTALGRLVHDFFCTKPDEMYHKPIAERTRYFKEDSGYRKGDIEMSRLLEQYIQQRAEEYMQQRSQEYGNKRFEDGITYGLSKGAANASKDFAVRMLQAGETLAKTVRYTGLSMYAVRKIAKQLKEGK